MALYAERGFENTTVADCGARSHGGVVSVCPPLKQKSPSRVCKMAGLCWRGCGSGSFLAAVRAL